MHACGDVYGQGCEGYFDGLLFRRPGTFRVSVYPISVQVFIWLGVFGSAMRTTMEFNCPTIALLIEVRGRSRY